jgi:uncharacterized cupin superfamily protein
MTVRTGVTIVHLDDCERTGNWSLVRRELGLQAFGMNVVSIPPGDQIPEHDETERDHEEVFFALSGDPTLVVDGEDEPLRQGTFARLDPALRRTVRNDGTAPVTVLIASAPRSSGYEPMGWA